MTVRELIRALSQYPYPDDTIVFIDRDGRRVPVQVSTSRGRAVLQEALCASAASRQATGNVTPLGHIVEASR